MDDLIKNGILKEKNIEGNDTFPKTRNTLGGEGILILIIQIAVLYFSFTNSIDLAWAGTSGTSFGFLLEFILIGIFQFFIIRFLIKKKGGFSVFVTIIGILTTFFIASILLGESQLLIHEYKSQSKVALESKIAKIEYQKIQTETKEVKIIGMDGNILKTDKDFSIDLFGVTLDGRETRLNYNNSKIINYLNENIIGHTFEISVPEFKSGAFPVSYAYDKFWLCQCDLLINGQSLVQKLN